MSLTPEMLLLVFGLFCAGCVASMLMWVSPRLTMVLWIAVLFFVPVWVGISVGFFWSLLVLVTLVAVFLHRGVVRLHWIDACVVAFVLVCTALLLVGEVGIAPYTIAILEWLMPYAWGRIVLSRMTRTFVFQVVAVAAMIAAALAIIEFLTSHNMFVLIPGSGVAHATWSPLQMRGGIIRAEGAFGHSIALGAVLAMASAFVIATRWHITIKLLALFTITTATIMTFSRIGLVTLAITIGLALILLREVSRWVRAGIATAIALAAWLIVPYVSGVFLDAGEEATGSAEYRLNIVALLDQVQILGGAGRWESLVIGDNYLGFFARSTDNALLSVLLRFGYLPSALLFATLFAAIILACRSGIGPAGVALIGQLPSLLAVAFITQYGTFVWFVVGLTVSSAGRRLTHGGIHAAEVYRPERELQSVGTSSALRADTTERAIASKNLEGEGRDR